MVGKSNTIFYFLPDPVVHTRDIFNVNTTGMVSWDCVCRHCKLCCFCTHCQILHEQPDIWTGHFELISDLKTEDKKLDIWKTICTEWDVYRERLVESITVYIPTGVAKDLRLNQLAGLPRTPMFILHQGSQVAQILAYVLVSNDKMLL